MDFEMLIAFSHYQIELLNSQSFIISEMKFFTFNNFGYTVFVCDCSFIHFALVDSL